MLFHNIGAYKKAIVPKLIITISIVTTLVIGFPLADDAVSLLSPSVQAINATSSNENNTRAPLITKNEPGNVNYDKALTVNPNNTKALSEKGDALLKLKNFNEAIASFDKALAIKPNNTDALNGKGVALAKLNNFDEAIASFDKVLDLKPNNTKALSEKGDALLKQKNFDEAVASFDKALAINPNNTAVLKDKEKALDALSRAK